MGSNTAAKIHKIINDNLGVKDGMNIIITTLNQGAFPAPCGRKRMWNKAKVMAFHNGEDWEKEDFPVASRIDFGVHRQLRSVVASQKTSIYAFVREAVMEKLEREAAA